MSQVTIYLDPEVETKARAAAAAAGLSLSRWISDVLRERTTDSWPSAVREAAGSWTDFPLRAEHAADADLPREPLR